ncbi:MAG TPA: type IV pilus twitching motility protein PilT [Thermoanaerobaculia bacterium]|nr:type IV pilus twitching motility protein PilT [Thermoanaerobaculia bacterium]
MNTTSEHSVHRVDGVADTSSIAVRELLGSTEEPSPPAEVGATPSRASPDSAAPMASRPRSAVELLFAMEERGASDLHLGAGEPARLRIDGRLVVCPELDPGSGEPEMTALLGQLMSERNWEDFRAKNDADFAFEVPGCARFRVSVYRDHRGLTAAIRRIPGDIPSADDLGLSATVRDLARLKDGLVLVTGPTGSGKSTTLAALIDLINEQRAEHIMTIEDPIEFVHRSKGCLVHQRELGRDTPSFKQALKAALREDPDVVLVGEMRDLETVAIALETAETGHLVLGTLHTTTAMSTVERLVDQFPGDRQQQVRTMLAGSLRAVIAQRLLPRVGGGRVAAQEIMVVSPAVSNLIREGKTFQIRSVMQTNRGSGMQPMEDALIDLVRRGLVAPEHALELGGVDRKTLTARIQGAKEMFDDDTVPPADTVNGG